MFIYCQLDMSAASKKKQKHKNSFDIKTSQTNTWLKTSTNYKNLNLNWYTNHILFPLHGSLKILGWGIKRQSTFPGMEGYLLYSTWHRYRGDHIITPLLRTHHWPPTEPIPSIYLKQNVSAFKFIVKIDHDESIFVLANRNNHKNLIMNSQNKRHFLYIQDFFEISVFSVTHGTFVPLWKYEKW